MLIGFLGIMDFLGILFYANIASSILVCFVKVGWTSSHLSNLTYFFVTLLVFGVLWYFPRPDKND